MNGGIDNNIEPVERTFYHSLLILLEKLGFEGLPESRIAVDGSYIDIYFRYGKERFILEVKFGDDIKTILTGIAQAHGYRVKTGIKNIIVICYPKDVKKIKGINNINKVVIDRTCTSIFLTDMWYKYIELSPEESLAKLKYKIDKKLKAVEGIEDASIILRRSIKILAKAISRYYTQKDIYKLFEYLTKDFGLFKGLSETKRKPENQILNLLAYILLNQILFYFLYSEKSSNDLSKLQKLTWVGELKKYFKEIRDIDYKPIFEINVIDKTPSYPEILEIINVIIEILPALRVTELKHDLYGRLIGESLPEETRSILASYYTKVNSAELLTQLAIIKGDETVWDLACGSGTLLVSAYKRKMKIIDDQRFLEKKDKKELHKKFLEKDLTGTDIMPFACHLTGLNLSAQNLDVFSNSMRVANKNSLGLYNLPIEVPEAYEDISSEFERLKKSRPTLHDFDNQNRKTNKNNKKSNVKKFTINKIDTILMNPPFTGINKLPRVYREECQKSILYKVSGKKINLWGYFLALSDKVLKNGGTLGAIIPVGLLRGKYTLKLRKHFLKNYSFEYIIKPVKGSFFSEATDFPDIILVAKKNICEDNHKVKIVTLHNPIDNETITNIHTIARELRTSFIEYENTDKYGIKIIKQVELYNNVENLIPYLYTDNPINEKIINSFIDKLKTSNKIECFNENLIKDGIQNMRPKGKSKELIITRAYSESRLDRANYRFKKDDDTTKLYYSDKNKKCYEINKKELSKTFRTITGIDCYDITKLYDYFIGYPEAPPENTHLIIPNRLRLNSSNTYLTALYSDEKIKPTNAFFMYLGNKEESKILCLFMLSTFYLAQFLRLAKLTDFREIKQIDLTKMMIPNMKKLTKKDKKDLITYFDENKNKHLSNITNQLKNRERLELDLLWTKIMNILISKKELENIYDCLIEEL